MKVLTDAEWNDLLEEIKRLKKENQKLAKQFVDSRSIEGCREKENERLKAEIERLTRL